MKTDTKTGHVVKEAKYGNTTCYICDDYCRDKTPEEVQAILDRIALILARSLARNAEEVSVG